MPTGAACTHSRSKEGVIVVSQFRFVAAVHEGRSLSCLLRPFEDAHNKRQPYCSCKSIHFLSSYSSNVCHIGREAGDWTRKDPSVPSLSWILLHARVCKELSCVLESSVTLLMPSRMAGGLPPPSRKRMPITLTNPLRRAGDAARFASRRC